MSGIAPYFPRRYPLRMLSVVRVEKLLMLYNSDAPSSLCLSTKYSWSFRSSSMLSNSVLCVLTYSHPLRSGILCWRNAVAGFSNSVKLPDTLSFDRPVYLLPKAELKAGQNAQRASIKIVDIPSMRVSPIKCCRRQHIKAINRATSKPFKNYKCLRILRLQAAIRGCFASVFSFHRAVS